jgi:hypothetical protein
MAASRKIDKIKQQVLQRPAVITFSDGIAAGCHTLLRAGPVALRRCFSAGLPSVLENKADFNPHICYHNI